MNNKTVFVAVDIGCIECGEDSNVLGIFATKEQAGKACDKARDEELKKWHGQHSFEVFEAKLPEVEG